jgi:hypothetical protein
MPLFVWLALGLLMTLPATVEAQLPKTVRTFKTPGIAAAQGTYTASVLAARKSYSQSLDTALKGAMASGNLAEANAINGTKTAVDVGGVLPPVEFKTGSAMQAKAAYEGAIARARTQYTGVLQGAQRQALAGGDLQEANAIQGEIDDLTASPAIAGKPSGTGPVLESADLVVSGTGFVAGVLADNELGWNNRPYRWVDVPSSLKGAPYTKTALNGKPEIKVRAKRDTTLQVFTTGQTTKIPGWDRTGIRFNTTHKSEMIVFKRKLSAGEEVDVPVLNWACTLVVLPESK